MEKAIFNWSGGKDSALALYKVLQQKKFSVEGLLTSVNEHFQRISMHGVRVDLLRQQASSIGIPLHQLCLPEMPTMEIYEQRTYEAIQSFTTQGIGHSIFGDIFLEDLRIYRESQLAKVNWQAVFPLWKTPTNELLNEFIDLGFKAIIVCVNSQNLDQSFAGRIIDNSFVNDLPKTVDRCGENGEYHSFVFDGPIFQKPIPFTIGETIYRSYPNPARTDTNEHNSSSTPNTAETGFWFTDLVPLT